MYGSVTRQIDRTTEHMCPDLARDLAHFVGLNLPIRTCVNCSEPIAVHYVQFAYLCADCRLECTDDSDVADAPCVYCNAPI